MSYIPNAPRSSSPLPNGPRKTHARLEIHSRQHDDRPVRGSGIDAVYDRLQFGVKGQGCIHDREYTGLALQVRERA